MSILAVRMEDSHLFRRSGISPALLLFIFLLSGPARAQTNIWTGAASANWESSSWSLGILPGAGQDIFFTNAGWKAVEIGQSTSQNYPQTLSIQSLTISSPANAGANELLMNYSGFQTPFIIGDSSNNGSLIIADTNSAITMLSSALVVRNAMTNGLNGGSTGAFSVDGTFNETSGSQVIASFLKVGNTGVGVFNLTNSFLNVSNTELIGGFQGAFNHQSGTNLTGDLIIGFGGVYNLYDGYLSGQIDLQGGSVYQWGGSNIANVINVTADNDSYTLNGGYLNATNVNVYAFAEDYEFFNGNFNQSGGYCTNGSINLYGDFNDYGPSISASFYISGGTLVAANLGLFMAYFNQTGGTVQLGSVSGGYIADLYLSGGSFNAQSVYLYGLENDLYSYLQVSAGTNQIGSLSLPKFSEAVFTGGQTTIQNFLIDVNGLLQHTGGILSITGTNTLGQCQWLEQIGGQFGKLQLISNAQLTVSPTNACVIRFADSSGLAWPNYSSLYIGQWNGSLSGGGLQQIYFGTNFSGLTPQQLKRVYFLEPAGLPNTYPARILATGEIVPYVPATLSLTNSSNGMQITVQGEAGQNYQIQTSSNLVNWILFTNQSSTNGIITFTDKPATNVHARFYRAMLTQ